jgi:hypothetical protein
MLPELLKLYHQALEMDPDDVEGNFSLAMLYLDPSYQETGIPDLNKALCHL